jgi:inner membrane transporter RhtA
MPTTLSPRHRYASFLPLLAILGSVTFLGLGTSWAKHALFPVVGAQGTTAIRVGLSAVVLSLLWQPWRRPLTRPDLIKVLSYGVALGAMNLCFYLSLRTIPFGVAVAIEFAGPLTVALMSSRRASDFIWVVCAVAGLGLLLPLGHDVSALDVHGVLFALAAALFWALYIVLGKRVGHLHAGHSVSLGMAAAALVVVPVGVWHAGAELLAPGVWLVGLAVAVLSSAIPISLEMVALKRLSPKAFGIMISMEPAVAACLAAVLLAEQLTALQWLAMVLIMTASIGSAMAAPRELSPAGAHQLT